MTIQQKLTTLTFATLASATMAFGQNKELTQSQIPMQAEKADTSYKVSKSGDGSSSVSVDNDIGESSYLEDNWERNPKPARLHGGVLNFSSIAKDEKTTSTFAIKIEKNGMVTLEGGKTLNHKKSEMEGGQYKYNPMGHGMLDKETLDVVMNAVDSAFAGATVSGDKLNKIKKMQDAIARPLKGALAGKQYSTEELAEIRKTAMDVNGGWVVEMKDNFAPAQAANASVSTPEVSKL